MGKRRGVPDVDAREGECAGAREQRRADTGAGRRNVGRRCHRRQVRVVDPSPSLLPRRAATRARASSHPGRHGGGRGDAPRAAQGASRRGGRRDLSPGGRRRRARGAAPGREAREPPRVRGGRPRAVRRARAGRVLQRSDGAVRTPARVASRARANGRRAVGGGPGTLRATTRDVGRTRRGASASVSPAAAAAAAHAARGKVSAPTGRGRVPAPAPPRRPVPAPAADTLRSDGRRRAKARPRRRRARPAAESPIRRQRRRRRRHRGVLFEIFPREPVAAPRGGEGAVSRRGLGERRRPSVAERRRRAGGFAFAFHDFIFLYIRRSTYQSRDRFINIVRPPRCGYPENRGTSRDHRPATPGGSSTVASGNHSRCITSRWDITRS